MTVGESETSDVSGRDPAGIDGFIPAQSMRELLGLEVEHLLPGLDVAATMLRRGDHQEALRTYSLLVLCDPTELRFQQGLATCALETGDFHIAALAASALISGNPDDPGGFLVSGRAFFGLRDFDAAIEDFRRAIALAEQAGDTVSAQQAAPLLQRALIAKEGQAAN